MANTSDDNSRRASDAQFFGGRGEPRNIRGYSNAPYQPYTYHFEPPSKAQRVWSRVGITLGIVFGAIAIIVGVSVVVFLGVCIALVASA